MQHSCSHSNAICNHGFQNTLKLRTHKHTQSSLKPPLQCRKEKKQTDRSRTRRTQEVHGGTFHCRLQPLYTKNTRFRAPASSPTQSPCNTLAAIPMRSATSPLPSFIATSLRHHFPSSPLPFVNTSLHHHFPSSPLPIVTTSLRHHFPSSPLPFVTTSLRHHFPSSPLPFVTTSLRHHFPSSPLPFIAFYSFVMYCDAEPPFIALFFCDVFVMYSHHFTFYSFVMYCDAEPLFIALFFCDVFVMYCHHFTTLHQCQVSQFCLSVTRKIASQLPWMMMMMAINLHCHKPPPWYPSLRQSHMSLVRHPHPRHGNVKSRHPSQPTLPSAASLTCEWPAVEMPAGMPGEELNGIYIWANMFNQCIRINNDSNIRFNQWIYNRFGFVWKSGKSTNMKFIYNCNWENYDKLLDFRALYFQASLYEPLE